MDKIFTTLEKESLLNRRKGFGVFVSEAIPRQKIRIALVGDVGLFQSSKRSPVWDLLVRRASERALARGEDFEFHFALAGDVPLHQNLSEAIQNIGWMS